jgi:hypothetical protein
MCCLSGLFDAGNSFRQYVNALPLGTLLKPDIIHAALYIFNIGCQDSATSSSLFNILAH